MEPSLEVEVDDWEYLQDALVESHFLYIQNIPPLEEIPIEVVRKFCGENFYGGVPFIIMLQICDFAFED